MSEKIARLFHTLEGWVFTHRKKAFILLGIGLSLIAALEYFTNLLFFSCFVDDEFQSAYAALDVATIGETSYDRAFPATFLLAQWIKVFGFSEVSCRSLSAVYGILAVLSLVYITAKWFDSVGYTAVVGMMFLAEPILTYYFRFVRMYSLAVLLCLWVYFLLFQGVEKHWGYIIPAFFLLLLSGWVHVNCLILLGGVAVYIFIKALLTKKKRYVVTSLCVIAVLLFSLVNYVVYKQTGAFLYNPGSIYNIFVNFVSVGTETHFEYLKYFLRTSGMIPLSILLIAIVIFGCIKRKQLKNEVLYVSSISCITVLFFCVLSDRYFTEQYILMAVPFFLMLLGYAYPVVVQWKKGAGYGMMIALLVFSSLLVCKAEYTYISDVNPKNMDYREAYGKIQDYYDVEEESVPTIESMIRTVYYDQIVPHYEMVSFDRTRDMEIWMEFGKQHPTGIVTVEWMKMPQLTQGVQDVILNWTDRISGEEYDDSGVNVSYYCFADCDEQVTGNYKEDGIYWDDSNLYLVLDRAGIESVENRNGSQMLFVKLLVKTDIEEQERHVGLYVPERSNTELVAYTIPLEYLRGLSGKQIQYAEITDLKLMNVE